MLPGGHVENWENPTEAALRETHAETGLSAQLIQHTPWPDAHIPAVPVATQLWIFEQQVPADSRHHEPHVHVDHLYLAIADPADTVAGPELPFAWYHAAELDSLNMFADTRAFGLSLFSHIDDLTSPNAITSSAGSRA